MSDQDSGKAARQSRWGGPSGNATAGGPADPARAQAERLAHEISAHLARGRADLARDAIGALARMAPDSPWIAHFARQAAIVDFRWPMARAGFVPAPRPAPPAEAVDLVAFHVELPRAPSGIHGAIDYASVLALSFESARLRAPRARRILLTDEATRVPQSMAVDEVRRFPIDREALMYERMRVQSLYVEGREPGRVSVLMDSDVVVNREPAPVFGEAFDVGLTWRPGFPDAPFNGGMIFVSEGGGAAEFFRKARACYDALAADVAVASLFPRDLRAWWGDQFALAAVVGIREYCERTTDGIAVDGLRVRLFACETHNFTLEPSTDYRLEDLRRKHFVHFKGNRKGLQAQYLDAMRQGRL